MQSGLSYVGPEYVLPKCDKWSTLTRGWVQAGRKLGTEFFFVTHLHAAAAAASHPPCHLLEAAISTWVYHEARVGAQHTCVGV